MPTEVEVEAAIKAASSLLAARPDDEHDRFPTWEVVGIRGAIRAALKAAERVRTEETKKYFQEGARIQGVSPVGGEIVLDMPAKPLGG